MIINMSLGKISFLNGIFFYACSYYFIKMHFEGEFMRMKGLLLLKSVFVAYIVTTGLLLLLAFGLYKFDLSEKVVQGSIIGIYVIATFIGGRIAGKLAKTKRFAWGILTGAFYFLIMFFVSFFIYQSSIWGEEMLLATSLCIGGGMLGAMIS